LCAIPLIKAGFHRDEARHKEKEMERTDGSTIVIRRFHSSTSDHGSEDEICLQVAKRSSTRHAATVLSGQLLFRLRTPCHPWIWQ
jgi:hypothetical protein